jgi:hypothetical protein
MADGVEDVFVGDAVLARRVVNFHPLIVIRKAAGGTRLPGESVLLPRGAGTTRQVSYDGPADRQSARALATFVQNCGQVTRS